MDLFHTIRKSKNQMQTKNVLEGSSTYRNFLSFSFKNVIWLMHCTIGHRDEYLERKSKDSPSSGKMSSSTYNLLIDQVVMAPPKLYLTFLTVDVTKSLLTSVLPNASRKSIAILASALSDSLRFWPLSIYVL